MNAGAKTKSPRRPLRRLSVLVVLASVLVVVGAGKASSSGLHCGAVLTSDTTLDRDLIDCSGAGLVIGAPNITVNLAGHVVDGVGAGDGIANRAGHNGVRIEHGRVQQFENGVVLVGASGNVLRELEIANTIEGIVLGRSRGIRVEANTITGSEFDGIAVIRSRENVVSDNVVSASGDGIFLDRSSENRLAGNTLVENAFGIDVQFSQRNRISANRATRNIIGIGLGAVSDSRVDGNIVTANSLFGIDLFGGSSDNRVDGNVARSNGDGIFTSPSTTGSILVGNVAEANLDDGIDVRNAATRLAENTANDNGDLGIEAVAGVTDGGGNRASHNGNPAQCVSIVCQTA